MLSIENARRTASLVSWTHGGAVGTRPIHRSNKLGPLKRVLASPPKLSERSQQILRRYALEDSYKSDPKDAVQKLQAYAVRQPSLEVRHAVAEIAYQQGQWAAKLGQSEKASMMFTTALAESYRFLFDQKLNLSRNAYDPQFRSISDIYNHSLEEVIRSLIKQKKLNVGEVVELKALDRQIRFSIESPGKWQEEDTDRFEISGDFETEGVNNFYHTYGLGVPLIAVRKKEPSKSDNEKYYPPGLTMAFTAFLQIDDSAPVDGTEETPHDTNAKLSLLNPLEQIYAQVNERWIPLESDITTPMAYFLDDPLLNTNVFATFALLNADFARQYQGIYMLEPYDPKKIPVVMIHGLWSSPVTWLQMFNDLRADPEIHQHYQFWFCLYPSGQPFWESARQVRDDLDRVRNDLWKTGESEQGIDEMVLVGHSMGGLISRLLTMESGDEFWNIISDKSFSELKGDEEVLQRLRDTYFFQPVRSVTRVITIGTPHHGSTFANETTRWLSQKVITLPQTVKNDYMKLAKNNKDNFKNTKPLTINTSIDSLSPDSPFVRAMLETAPSESVKYHNIIGNVQANSLYSRLFSEKQTDGVVSVESAMIPGTASNIEVNAEHSMVHQHPRTILDVKRILFDHLVENQRLSEDSRLILPASFDSEDHD